MQYVMGHEVWTNSLGSWYSDGTPFTDARPCAACGLNKNNPDDPDPCFGFLPGVNNACCGHGVSDEFYID